MGAQHSATGASRMATRWWIGIKLAKAVADRYVQRAVCPAKHAGLYTRGEHLVDLVKKGHADGVIFLYLKFCDPHAFDYPYIKTMLDGEGIPNLLLELDDSSPTEGQFRTRCEAFVEML